MNEEPRRGESSGNLLGKMSTAGSALTGPLLIGILLDWQFGSTPWGTLAGTALGFLGCMAYLYQQAKEK